MKSSIFIAFIAFAGVALAQTPTIGACTVLPANNIWNTRVDTLPVSPNSSTYVNAIGSTTGLHPDFGSGTLGGGPIGIPFITVPGTQTKYPATFTYASESDPGPYAIPLDAPIEGGSSSTGDRHAIAVDTTNCILYELYAAYPQTSSWKAGSGAIFNLTSNALRTAGWTSTDAAGLPVLPGLVRYDEVAAGAINHALRFTVPTTQKAYVWPARHYASNTTNTSYPPMGQRFRLKASFDISSYPADVQVILTALKKYGMMVADNGSAWYVSGAPDSRWNNTTLHTLSSVPGSAFEAVDVSSLMIDPNSGQAVQSGTTAPPSISSVTPNPLSAGNFTLTVNGSGFQSGATVALSGAPLSTKFVSSTQLTASGSTSATGSSVPVTVTNPDGQVSTGFNIVVTSGAPTLTSISPASGPRGATVAVTLTGTNFVAPATIYVAGGGVSVSAVTVVSATQITAQFAIANTAATGGHAVSVQTSNGTSGTVTFTVGKHR